jgi:hypothetical protein
MKHIHRKPEVNMEDFLVIHPWLYIVFGAFVAFAQDRDLPVKITSVVSDTVDVQRVSKTHATGRAIDVSVRGWSTKDIEDACNFLNKNFPDIGAISAKDGKRRACVYHKVFGGAYHFHLQVAPASKDLSETVSMTKILKTRLKILWKVFI